MDLITELLNCLNSIDYSIFDEDYLDGLLDSRDSDPFDREWCRVYDEIEALKADENYTDEMEENQSKIREKAYMIVAQNVESELAEYVSDDFGPIYDSLILKYKDKWLDRLIESYKNKKILAGEL